jgi:HK97 gp10 family phage protein
MNRITDTSIKVECPDLIKLEKCFKDMQFVDKKKIINSAFRKALAPTVLAAQKNIHSVTGNLSKSIGIVISRDELVAIVGARVRGGYKGYHAHLVENGTIERHYIIKKTRSMVNPQTGQWLNFKKGDTQNTGKMNPNAGYAGFLRRAVKSTGNEALNIMANAWYEAIDKIIVKNGL